MNPAVAAGFAPAALLGCIILAAAAPSAHAAAPKPPPAAAAKALAPNFNPVIPAGTDRVDISIARGLEFIMQLQTPEGVLNDCLKCRNYHTAVSALAVMAFAASGHHPVDRSPEGMALRRGLDFVLRTDRQVPNGSFGATDQSMMFGHGICTTMLTSALAMGLDPEKEALIRTRSVLALNLIMRAQSTRKVHPEDVGGWRYTPDSMTSDVPITAWQVAALWSGRRAGFRVPDAHFVSAAQFLRYCHSGGVFTYEHIDWTASPFGGKKGGHKGMDIAAMQMGSKPFPT